MSDENSENSLSILDKISAAKEQVLAGGVTSVSSGGRRHIGQLWRAECGGNFARNASGNGASGTDEGGFGIRSV